MSPSRSLLPGRRAAPAGDAPCPPQLPVLSSPLKREREGDEERGRGHGGGRGGEEGHYCKERAWVFRLLQLTLLSLFFR